MREISARTTRVELALERSHGFRPLSEDASETWLWQNHDLASLIENRLNLVKDPVAMSDRDRAEYGSRVTSDGLRLVSPRSRENRSFWILDGHRRVGTIAMARAPSSDALLRVSSLYVVPGARGRGHATRALGALHAVALKCGFSGTRLATEWSWQRAIHFYLGLGMWVWRWKHAIDFVWHRALPKWTIEVDEDRALFATNDGSSSALLIEALRRHDRLRWRPSSRLDLAAMQFAPCTFALALAARGWPLLLEDEVDEVGAGAPPALAAKIRQFEARDRRHGWHVDTPRIPGLDYSDAG